MLASQQASIFGIQSTAGAVPIRNEKGPKTSFLLTKHFSLFSFRLLFSFFMYFL